LFLSRISGQTRVSAWPGTVDSKRDTCQWPAHLHSEQEQGMPLGDPLQNYQNHFKIFVGLFAHHDCAAALLFESITTFRRKRRQSTKARVLLPLTTISNNIYIHPMPMRSDTPYSASLETQIREIIHLVKSTILATLLSTHSKVDSFTRFTPAKESK
jgi:hypothetical protein